MSEQKGERWERQRRYYTKKINEWGDIVKDPSIMEAKKRLIKRSSKNMDLITISLICQVGIMWALLF